MRSNWIEAQNGEININLNWQPISKQLKYGSNCESLFNHYEFHKELTNKSKLIENLGQYCESVQIQLFSIIPMTYILDFDSPYISDEYDDFSS